VPVRVRACVCVTRLSAVETPVANLHNKRGTHTHSHGNNRSVKISYRGPFLDICLHFQSHNKHTKHICPHKQIYTIFFNSSDKTIHHFSTLSQTVNKLFLCSDSLRLALHGDGSCMTCTLNIDREEEWILGTHSDQNVKHGQQLYFTI
jgi:hypothetical protein